jgi:menaquinone-dependent protoporphyrinogen oxidase
MRVLVAYGSKMGGTQGLAETLGSAFESQGAEVTVQPARAVMDVRRYDAVVLGGALYANRWHKDARRFVKRHRGTLVEKPVWLFSSGPLDDSALTSEIPPVRHVVKAMDLVGARGHMTFGGRLEADATGFPAAVMAKTNAGDWRDPDQVRDWAQHISEELGTLMIS